MDPRLEKNRAHWDEIVPLHAASEFYDVESFLAGHSKLKSIELEEMGDVAGKSLLHLQCHFGMDTLSWARLGAEVTGIDFSEVGIAKARDLAEAANLPARFVVSPIDELRDRLDGEFNLVFTSYGALTWLPDLTPWAEAIAHFLKPGGQFLVVECHPFSEVFENEGDVTGFEVGYDYLAGKALRFDCNEGTYADPATSLKNTETWEWIHPMGEILGALLTAGLQVESFREYPYTCWQQFPFLEKREDGWYHLPDDMRRIPLLFSLRATKP